MKLNLTDQEAHLLYALLGRTYAGLAEQFDELGRKLEKRGYDITIEPQPELNDLLGARAGKLLNL